MRGLLCQEQTNTTTENSRLCIDLSFVFLYAVYIVLGSIVHHFVCCWHDLNASPCISTVGESPRGPNNNSTEGKAWQAWATTYTRWVTNLLPRELAANSTRLLHDTIRYDTIRASVFFLVQANRAGSVRGLVQR